MFNVQQRSREVCTNLTKCKNVLLNHKKEYNLNREMSKKKSLKRVRNAKKSDKYFKWCE